MASPTRHKYKGPTQCEARKILVDIMPQLTELGVENPKTWRSWERASETVSRQKKVQKKGFFGHQLN